MTEPIARRQFAPLYIWLDTAFLILFLVLLLRKKKYMTVAVGLVMGLVYLAVDYGIFHLICHSRRIPADADRQFAAGNQSGNALRLRAVYRLFPALDRAVSPAAPEAFVFRPYRRRQSYGTLPLRKESYGIISEICAPSAGMAQAHAQRLLP